MTTRSTHHRRPGRNVTALALLLGLALAGCEGDGGGGSGLPTGPGKFNYGPFGLNQSVTHVFATSGTFGYHCIPHQLAGMTGTVQVNAGGMDSVPVAIGPGNVFNPQTANVKPGGYVRWHNVSTMTNHTVTQD